jgi:hydroxymethylpyrimidine pyrophosphatase-like HAD family hydrolase
VRKLFAFDLDGTLVHPLEDGSRGIPHEVRSLLSELAKKADIVVATGRRYKAALLDVVHMPPMPFHIVHNGLVIKSGEGKTLHSSVMENAVGMEVIRLVESQGFDPFVVSDGSEAGSDFSISRSGLQRSPYLQLLKDRPAQVTRELDSYDEIDYPFLEVAVIGEYADLKRLLTTLSPQLPTHLRGVLVRNIGHRTYSALEIFDRGASKWSAVDFVKKQLGSTEVIAIGDDGNDREMIEFADQGIVMDHADDDLKNLADRQLRGVPGLIDFLKEYNDL